MQVARYIIEGTSEYSQSKVLDEKRKERETPDDHEKRAWKQRLHVREGVVVIPPMAMKNALSDAAKFLGIQIPGKGKQNYTKHFEAGVQCTDHATIMVAGDPVSPDKVKGEWLHVPSDGKRGGSKRVMKCFPRIEAGWTARFDAVVLDDLVTEDVFKLHLERAGQFIGLGRFRPRNNGYYGRFKVVNFQWLTMDEALRALAKEEEKKSKNEKVKHGKQIDQEPDQS